MQDCRKRKTGPKSWHAAQLLPHLHPATFTTSACLASLCKETRCRVLLFLSPSQLFALHQTCRTLDMDAKSEVLWRQICLRAHGTIIVHEALGLTSFRNFHRASVYDPPEHTIPCVADLRVLFELWEDAEEEEEEPRKVLSCVESLERLDGGHTTFNITDSTQDQVLQHTREEDKELLSMRLTLFNRATQKAVVLADHVYACTSGYCSNVAFCNCDGFDGYDGLDESSFTSRERDAGVFCFQQEIPSWRQSVDESFNECATETDYHARVIINSRGISLDFTYLTLRHSYAGELCSGLGYLRIPGGKRTGLLRKLSTLDWQ